MFYYKPNDLKNDFLKSLKLMAYKIIAIFSFIHFFELNFQP